MILEKVQTFVAEQFNMDENDITEDLTFEEIGADDFDIADLADALEGEFDIEFNEDELSDIEDIADLVKLITTLVELS